MVWFQALKLSKDEMFGQVCLYALVVHRLHSSEETSTYDLIDRAENDKETIMMVKESDSVPSQLADVTLARLQVDLVISKGDVEPESEVEEIEGSTSESPLNPLVKVGFSLGSKSVIYVFLIFCV